jgi:hypothetical protein
MRDENINHIRLIRSFKSLFSFLIFNPAISISSFPIILTARFPYLFLLNIVFSYSVEDDGLFEKGEILRE